MNHSPNSADKQSTPRQRPPRKLPAIGAFYAKKAPLWRYQILGDQKPTIWQVTHHSDSRVVFDNNPEHTASGYWVREHLTQCQQDGSPLDPEYITQQREHLDRQEQWAASRPSLSAVVVDLLRDHEIQGVPGHPEFTPGDRIRVLLCTDEHAPIPSGATGTVTYWNPNPQLRQLGVAWDAPHAHRRLMLTLTDNGDRIARI